MCLMPVRAANPSITSESWTSIRRIAAPGAGGISKAYYPEENRLERVPNVTNFEIYIERLDEMIQRKERALYKPFGG